MSAPPNTPEPYQFDETIVAGLAAAIDDAATAEDQSHHGIPTAALAQLGTAAPLSLESAVHALFFHDLELVGHDDPEQITVHVRGDSSGPVNPYPGPVSAATDDEVALWTALSTAVTHPLPRSLLHDLLFLRRAGDVGAHAHEAIELYRQTARQPTVHPLTRSYSALRALALCTLTRKTDEIPAVLVVLKELALLDLTSANRHTPGATLPVIAALARLTTAETSTCPNETRVADILNLALAKYGTPLHIDFIADVFQMAGVISDTRAQEVRRIRASRRLDDALSQTEPAARLFALEDAARAAQMLGYADLYNTAIAELQQVDTTAIDWTVIESDVEYPPHIVHGYVHQFVRHGSWRTGLGQWLTTDPPSGAYQENEKLARDALSGSVFQHILTRFHLGTHGLPERQGSGASVLDDRIRDVEFQHALVDGFLYCQALQAIGDLAQTTSERELVTFIVGRYRCHTANATILAKALKLFWDNEFLTCSYLVTPFTEAGVRTLMLELNEPIYRTEAGNSKGQYAMLGALLPRLADEGLDNDWIRFLQTLLLSEGQNYRNDIAHGFLRQMDPIVATLLIRASALFLIMPLGTATAAELAELKARPVPKRLQRSLLRRIAQTMNAARREFSRP